MKSSKFVVVLLNIVKYGITLVLGYLGGTSDIL